MGDSRSLHSRNGRSEEEYDGRINYSVFEPAKYRNPNGITHSMRLVI